MHFPSDGFWWNSASNVAMVSSGGYGDDNRTTPICIVRGNSILRLNLHRSDGPAGMRLVASLCVAAVLVTGTVHAREICAARVLQAELLPTALWAVVPSAHYGYWLTTATLEVQISNTPRANVVLSETLPWQMTLRQGEIFRIPCEYAFSSGLSLAALASAPSFRSASARSSAYARVR